MQCTAFVAELHVQSKAKKMEAQSRYTGLKRVKDEQSSLSVNPDDPD